MSNEKFTPGRYRRAFNMSRNGKKTVRGLSHSRIENENGVVIAFTAPQKSRQEQIANTNLLSAAPDMYALLSIMVSPTIMMGQTMRNDDLRTAIESVLKKARGEEI